MDPWDFADPVDILSKLPDNFNELIASKKWQERKEALDALLTLATDNVRLDPKANYNEIAETLSKTLAKDANINVTAVAAKCITQFAKGLRTKFGPYAASIAPIIFEKFKEKKALLRDPLIEAIDAIYPTTTLDAICDDIAAALVKPNPQIKTQTNLFLYRVFKNFNVQTAPKKVVKALTPIVAKCTGEPDPEAREASFQALGAIMKAIGKTNAMTMLGDVANDKTKMAQIEKFHNQAVEEAQKEAAEKAAAEQASAPPKAASSDGGETESQPTTSSSAAAAQPKAVAEPDPWEFADPVDILPKLPDNFNELIASKKWQERKEALDALLTLATDNVRLDPKANYNEIAETLSKILAKDANINVTAVAAKCITQLAKGLRNKFGPYAASLAPIIFEKFKEKKVLLRDPLIEAIDAVYATTNLDIICDDIAAALGKPNPNIKIQTNLFLYRVFKVFNLQTAPKKVVKALTPLIAKCTGESDPEAREAAFSALGAIMKAIGKTNAMTMLGDVANDKTKMAQIEKFYNQAVEEAGVEVVSEMVQSIHKSAEPAKAAANANGPKVVKPKGKPTKPAEDENVDENSEDEPLRPMGKQDDEKAKGRSASKNARKSVAPPPPPSKSPEPVESVGVLSSASNRNARMKEERALKALKWNFKTPTEEHITQLQNQFNEVGKPDFVKMLFSKDFKLHIKALDQISNQLQLDPSGIINNCDLILKWATFRFFDTNPQSLNKTLEVISALLEIMENENSKLNDSDVTAFIPFLLLKSGDTKDLVRNLVRKIVSQTSILHVPAKIFPLILDALNSKNSRQKAECLQLADTFLEYFGINISQNPRESMKTIANCIAERDANARNAALNCIGTVWRKSGDSVYNMIGNLPAKEKAMLDERIKRMGREPAPVMDETTITLRLAPRDATNTNLSMIRPAMSEDITETPRVTSNRSRSTSRLAHHHRPGAAGHNDSSYIIPGSAGGDREDTFNTTEIRLPKGPPKSRFSLSTQHYAPLPTLKMSPFPTIDFGLRPVDVPPQLHQSNLNRPLMTSTPRRSESINSITSVDIQADQIERTVNSLSSVMISTVIEATNQLVYLFRDQNNYNMFLIEKADLIAKTVATQLSVIRTQHLIDRESDEETNALMRSLCNFLTFFMHQKAAVSRISHTTLKLFFSELLRFLCDERTSHLPDHPHIVRSVNVITVKLCENSDVNECFAASLHLLDSYISTEAPQKLVELLLKCIFKHSESFLQPNHAPLQIDRILTELDNILNKYYSKQAQGIMKRVIDALKLVTQRFAAITFSELDPYLTLIKQDGYLHTYLQTCIQKLQESAQAENVPPKKNERTLEEMISDIQDTIATGGLTELYFYLETHPEEKPEFDKLIQSCPIPAMVQYCFDEFNACKNAKTPKSFHQIYSELAGAAGHSSVPVSARSSNGYKYNGIIPQKTEISLPFDVPANNFIPSGAAGTNNSGGGGGHERTPSSNFTPIPPQDVINYKKRLSSLRLNQP